MRDNYKIAVLLTCHNRREKTLSCLHSLFEVSLPKNYNIDVFLVDDGSIDGTGDAVKKLYPKINLINGDGNLFWNRGMNLAWQSASEKFSYDFYLWLNDDVVLHEDSFNILLNDFMKLGNSNTIIAGACQSAAGNVTYSGINNLRDKEIIKPNGDVQHCDYFNGNVVLIPSCVFEQIGFLDPIFHHAQGDFDFGLRAKKKGINSYVSSLFIGLCERNSEIPKWCNPKYKLLDRWKHFRSPLGGRPKLTFINQKRHIGLTVAIFHYITIHLRLVFPKLWILVKKR